MQKVIPVNFDTLNNRGRSAATVIKLMMACNDLLLANQALSNWKQEERPNLRSRRAGGCTYFSTQISHLSEGLKVISDIQNDDTLRRVVDGCDSQTRESFNDLKQYLPGGAQNARFEQLMRRIRHNVTFHYDESRKLVERAIARKAERREISTITRGSTAYDWHFKVGDDVVDSIGMEIWGIDGPDYRANTDRIAAEVHRMLLLFVDFAGEFIWTYCDR